MPELPEVETARRLLDAWIRGGTITHARAMAEGVVAAPSAFARKLEGRTIREVDRRGKWLRLALDDDLSLFSHLGMTGRWVKVGENAAVPWERARLDVERGRVGTRVRYVDPRRFGRLVVARGDIPEWRALGPDPLAEPIDLRRLAALFARTRRPIKDVLLDQSVLAGVGNIQATEALWKARVDPRTPADRLPGTRVKAIARSLSWSIARTLKDLAKDGEEPGYVSDAGGRNPFCVYGRRGEPCPRCKRPILRIVVGGRGTYLCEACQTRA